MSILVVTTLKQHFYACDKYLYILKNILVFHAL